VVINIKKYILLYNFDEDERAIVDEVVEYVGEDQVKVMDYGLMFGEKVSDWNSLWVTEECYLVAMSAFHFAYFVYRLDEDFDDFKTDLAYAKEWFENHKNDGKYIVEE
jgi:hypothetical protein